MKKGNTTGTALTTALTANDLANLSKLSKLLNDDSAISDRLHMKLTQIVAIVLMIEGEVEEGDRAVSGSLWAVRTIAEECVALTTALVEELRAESHS